MDPTHQRVKTLKKKVELGADLSPVMDELRGILEGACAELDKAQVA